MIKWKCMKFNWDSGPPPLVKARKVRGGPENLWTVDLNVGYGWRGGVYEGDGGEFWWEWRVT
jgi:hypothetical protein